MISSASSVVVSTDAVFFVGRVKAVESGDVCKKVEEDT